MNKDIPHTTHYCLVQKIGERSRRWPLKIVRVNWHNRIFARDEGGWLAEPLNGDYRVLAAFLTECQAERMRKTLMPVRYRVEVFPMRGDIHRVGERYYCLSLEETNDLLKMLGVAKTPGCIYTYQKDKESYTQWLKRQHP